MSNSRSLTIVSHQDRALAAMLSGQDIAEAAAQAVLSRRTVSRWVHEDDAFVAALNRARVEVWSGVEDSSRQLYRRTLEVVGRDLDGPDAAMAALALLRTLSRMDLRPTGPTNAGDSAWDRLLAPDFDWDADASDLDVD